MGISDAGISQPRSTDGADVLRGVAIIAVVVHHAAGVVPPPWVGWTRSLEASPSTASLWLYPVTFGWAGVSLFFVISGFCIHLSYLRNGVLNAKSFYWRRFWRIYPAYLVALLVFAQLSHLPLFTRSGAAQLISHALFVHDFQSETFFGINPSFWSIATEIQLYLLFPALLFVRSWLGLERALVCLFVIGCGWRLFALAMWGLPDHVVHWAWTFPLVTWFDWGLGALVAERFREGRRTFNRPIVWIIGLVPMFVLSTLFKPFTIFSFTLAAILSAVILDAAMDIRWGGRWWAWGLAFIGSISYSLYLWHQPLIPRILARLESLLGSTPAAWIILIALLAGVSWISFQLLERPGIAIGHRFWGRSRKPQPIAVADSRTGVSTS